MGDVSQITIDKAYLLSQLNVHSLSSSYEFGTEKLSGFQVLLGTILCSQICIALLLIQQAGFVLRLCISHLIGNLNCLMISGDGFLPLMLIGKGVSQIYKV